MPEPRTLTPRSQQFIDNLRESITGKSINDLVQDEDINLGLKAMLDQFMLEVLDAGELASQPICNLISSSVLTGIFLAEQGYTNLFPVGRA